MRQGRRRRTEVSELHRGRNAGNEARVKLAFAGFVTGIDVDLDGRIACDVAQPVIQPIQPPSVSESGADAVGTGIAEKRHAPETPARR